MPSSKRTVLALALALLFSGVVGATTDDPRTKIKDPPSPPPPPRPPPPSPPMPPLYPGTFHSPPPSPAPPPYPPPPGPPKPKENDHLWVCALRYEEDKVKWANDPDGCSSSDARKAFEDLALVVHPVKETLAVNKTMSSVPGGCCVQTALLDTDRTDDLDSPGLLFMKDINPGRMFMWSKSNKLCGPTTTIIVIVGWNMYAPPAYTLYGCNPGPAGLALPQLCRC